MRQVNGPILLSFLTCHCVMDGFQTQMPKHNLCCRPDAEPYLLVSVWLPVATSPLPAQEVMEPAKGVCLCVFTGCAK